MSRSIPSSGLVWLALASFTGLSHAGISFNTDTSFGSDPATAKITITDLGNDLRIDLMLVDGTIGDLRGFFFNVVNPLLLNDLSVSGADVTDSQFSENNVTNLGGGAVITPAGPFDAGVEIGTSGAGGDFISSTFFILSSTGLSSGITDLSINDIIALSDNESYPLYFGVRVTSVGPNGDGSSKIGATNTPEPATFVLWSVLGLGGLCWKRRKAPLAG